MVEAVKHREDVADGIGKLVEPTETLKFIDWLPEPLSPSHAYYIVMMVRAKHLRERGIKIRDTALETAMVPGYLPRPKQALYLELRRLALLASQPGLYTDTRMKPGTDVPAETWLVPPDAIFLFVSPNLHDWVEATVKATKEFMESLWQTAYTGASRPRRLDTRIRALLPTTKARGVPWRFSLDVDEPSILGEVLERVAVIVGFKPAVVSTTHGGHILLSWSEVPVDARREFAEFIKRLDDEYGGAVEYHRIPFEPLPGAVYKDGFVVRFEPPEK